MKTTIEPNTALLGQEIALGDVDRALKELWAVDETRTRASLMNFAVYTESPSDVDETVKTLATITEEHACRGLLIIHDTQSPKAQIRSWVTAHCQLHDGRNFVCSEQLTFWLTEGSANLVRNTVFAHLDSDLPLVLWWQGNLSETFTERLYSVVDLLFVDSSTWSHPQMDFAKLDEALEHSGKRLAVFDLSWLRTHYFRSALASCFNSTIALEELTTLKRIKVSHGANHRISGLLFVAWLVARLKAEVEVNGERHILVLKSGRRVEVEIMATASEESLQSVILESDNASFQVRHEEASSFVNAEAQIGAFYHEHLLPADLPTDADLIKFVLSRLGRKSLYVQMLPILKKFIVH